MDAVIVDGTPAIDLVASRRRRDPRSSNAAIVENAVTEESDPPRTEHGGRSAVTQPAGEAPRSPFVRASLDPIPLLCFRLETRYAPRHKRFAIFSPRSALRISRRRIGGGTASAIGASLLMMVAGLPKTRTGGRTSAPR